MSQTQFENHIEEIITTVTEYRDQGQWQKLEQYFTDTPYVDDHVVTNEKPGVRPLASVLYSWKRLVRDVYYGVRHRIGVVQIERTNRTEAEAKTEAEARYYTINKGHRYVRTIVGTYTYKLVRVAGKWKIRELRFAPKKQSLHPVGM